MWNTATSPRQPEICPSRVPAADSDQECSELTTIGAPVSGNEDVHGLGGIFIRIEAGGTSGEPVLWMIDCVGDPNA